MQTPKINLQEGIYVTPYHLYISTLLSNSYIMDCHQMQNLLNLKNLLKTQSKLECSYSYAFKARAFINELLESKHFKPELVLGKELSTMLPIGVNNSELREIYQILIADQGVTRLEVDTSGQVRLLDGVVEDMQHGVGDGYLEPWMSEYLVPKNI